MSTGNYPPAGQPEPEPGSAGTARPSAGTPSGAGSPEPAAGVSRGVPATDATPATGPRAAADQPGVTRAGVVWAAVVAALVLLILLIIFILQNQDLVLVRYFGLEGTVPLGMALFIASVSGAVVVAVAGGARILQLRTNAHRARAAQRR